MHKQRLDLNRYKKIYTSKRKSPQFFNKTHEAYGATISIAGTDSGNAVVENSGVISSTPSVTVTTTENVNVWVTSVARSQASDPTSDWLVTVQSSASFTGTVHVLLVEIS